jgi:hypothetical protein
MKKILALVFAVTLSACSAPETATKALQAAGYSDIQINGYAYFGCSDDDSFHTEFKATGPTGIPVSGVVCSGIVKGATIRLK